MEMNGNSVPEGMRAAGPKERGSRDLHTYMPGGRLGTGWSDTGLDSHDGWNT